MSLNSNYWDLLGDTASLYQYRNQSTDLTLFFTEVAERLTKSSPTYKIEAKEVANLSYWVWADEVNCRENEINVDVSGLDLYVKLLLEELHGNFRNL